MTADDFRDIALDMPGVVEKAHQNHPDFRIYDKVFASLGVPDEGWGMVKLTPDQQSLFISQAPTVFQPCNGAWGQRGYTSVRLEAASATILRSALSDAAENLAVHAPKRKNA
ncbi:MAG: MmcQ/YjbR family DNA-binding protein [Verrucomicrobiaceae bacterium]